MINNILRSAILMVIFVLVQVLLLNNIHFLRMATPFLYESRVRNSFCWHSLPDC